MPDVQFIINVVYPAASSACTIMNVPTPPLSLPPGYELVDAINADPKRAASAMLTAAPAQQHIANTMLSESSIFGLVAWNAQEETALVAIRGTKTIWEWIEDYRCRADPVPSLSGSRAGSHGLPAGLRTYPGERDYHSQIKMRGSETNTGDRAQSRCGSGCALWF